MQRLAVLDTTFTIRNRIRELASREHIELIEALSPRQLLNLLSVPNDIGLIITEVQFPQEDGFAILAEIKALAGETPVMILTGENKRSSFIRGIRMGAADYVLKPFDDEFLAKRISELMGNRPRRPAATGYGPAGALGQGLPAMFVDFNSYLDKELKKAAKGKYPVSILITLLLDPESAIGPDLDRRYSDISDGVFDAMGRVLFDTDVFMRYGTRSFIGVFPFCGPENRQLIGEKLSAVYDGYLRKETDEATMLLLTSCASYPEDGENRETLMNVVEDRMAEKLREIVGEEP